MKACFTVLPALELAEGARDVAGDLQSLGFVQAALGQPIEHVLSEPLRSVSEMTVKLLGEDIGFAPGPFSGSGTRFAGAARRRRRRSWGGPCRPGSGFDGP